MKLSITEMAFCYYYCRLLLNIQYVIIIVPHVVPKIRFLSYIHRQWNILDTVRKRQTMVRVKVDSSKIFFQTLKVISWIILEKIIMICYWLIWTYKLFHDIYRTFLVNFLSLFSWYLLHDFFKALVSAYSLPYLNLSPAKPLRL